MDGANRTVNPNQSSLVLPLEAVSRLAGWATVGLLWLVTLLVVARRLAGALSQPPSVGSLFVLALVLGAIAIVIRVLDSSRGLSWATAGAIMLLGCAISVPEVGWWQATLFWVVLAGAITALIAFPGGDGLTRRTSSGSAGAVVARLPVLGRLAAYHAAVHPPTVSEAASDIAVAAARIAVGQESSDHLLQAEEESSDLRQSWTRVAAVDGSESIHGTLRTHLAEGQRTVVMHVAFCPPFATIPEVEFEQIEGPESSVKPASLLPYGARLEIRLQRPAQENDTVAVEFVAMGTSLRTDI